MKYKVGNKVRIKSLDWYNAIKDEDGDVPLIRMYEGQYNLIKNMSSFCGKVVTISNVWEESGYYNIEEDNGNYYWTDEMIECLVEKINNDTCKDFIWLYNFVTHLDLISHQIPIKVNGKKVINAKLTNNFELELITEE